MTTTNTSFMANQLARPSRTKKATLGTMYVHIVHVLTRNGKTDTAPGSAMKQRSFFQRRTVLVIASNKNEPYSQIPVR